jgi:translation initiation factor IF-3
MGDVISVDFGNKTKTNRDEHNERVVQNHKLKQDSKYDSKDLETRINNIRSSLNRINELMTELKGMCPTK